ncbi:MAG: SDR family oxidoreductase [Anaerolineales bacterium]|nr:MAG: SDR family oxidoreductase [Anaerolineales bacterium]
MQLKGKNVLITGAAVRLGAQMARSVAAEGGNVIIHYNSSQTEAGALQAELQQAGAQAYLLQADLGDPQQAGRLIERAGEHGPLFALVNSASIFEDINLATTKLPDWQRHLDVNLTAPFLLSQSFWKAAGQRPGRIVNLLDWRALRPGADHLPYTISKVGLAGLTHSLAVAMAPNISVNGIALGAILPPSDGTEPSGILENVPAGRWAELDELGQTLLFLLTGPAYITGEIIHLDGGRHLV